MTAYHEFHHYSPVHDCVMIRLSMFNANGGELFMLIPADNGRRYRERREEALEAIMTAIESNCQPGEVRIQREAA